MPRYDFAARRLYVNATLAPLEKVSLDQTQANYVRNVLHLTEGSKILAFNGRDGEWEASIAPLERRSVALIAQRMIRPQEPQSGLHYLFAPLKHARLDYMVEKAVEMGAGLLRPVQTRRCQAARVNTERMRAHATEAAEQCGILSVPEVVSMVPLDRLIATWDRGRLLVFCDEDAPVRNPCEILLQRRNDVNGNKLALLIGPEGGFEESERKALLDLPFTIRLPLGPRILRADTAAVAALALLQAVLGDWRG